MLASAVAVALVAAFMAVVPAASAATLFSDDFQDGNASGWSKSGGEWSVVTDGTPAFRQVNTTSELARASSPETQLDQLPAAGPGQAARVQRHQPVVGMAARSNSSTTFYRLALRAPTGPNCRW